MGFIFLIKRLFLFSFLAWLHLTVSAADSINTYKGDVVQIHSYKVLVDETDSLKIEDVVNRRFETTTNLSEALSRGTVWIRLYLHNLSGSDSLFLELRNPLLEEVGFFEYMNNQISNVQITGTRYPFYQRSYELPNFLYRLHLAQGQTSTVFIRVESVSQGHLPIYIGSEKLIIDKSFNNFLFIGLYCGVIFIMIFYNLFLYFSIKDVSYLYYIFYIFSVGLTQLILNGYTFMYLWPGNSQFAIDSVNFSGILSGVATLLFTRNFLNTRQLTPKFHKILGGLILLDIIAVFITIFFSRHFALNLINAVALVGSLFTIYCAFVVSQKNFRPAKFFLIAFSVFLIAVIIHVLRTRDIIPYTTVTAKVLEIGSMLQVLLLAFALADRINIYRKEALTASKEKERMVKEQNIILERQVHERTQELEESNNNLSNTLSQLKNTQSKLVESEKMASLGQLTAGIAHEINNPINFVTSNVKPLELDINDIQNLIKKYEEIDLSKNVEEQLSAINSYRKQIDLDYINEEIRTLLMGIRDGAHRTAEIVSNLKNFARIDEANVKFANLNEGLQSTLMLVKNSFPKDFILNKELDNIPDVECTPGKINQVFMNIITNGLQSISERQAVNPGPGILTIKSMEENGNVKISIKDNGIGIKDDVHEKIFEPFYTTKPVGQGTGLGMSIVKGIIDSHKGTIEVISNFGEGAEFIITLPVNYLA